MPSGAVHDAQIVSRIIPAAMMFVPSDDDIVLGAQVFADAIAGVLKTKT